MISKELFKELGIEAENYQDYAEGNILNDSNFMSPHDLAHKCKEWATNNGWYILSYYQHGQGYALPCEEIEETQKEWYEADTEPEAIFNACEFILEQKNEAM